MSAPTLIPDLPRQLTNPRPVILIGTAAWIIAFAVIWLSGDNFESLRPVSAAGLAVSLFGTSVFLLQARASRLGKKTAQSGLS